MRFRMKEREKRSAAKLDWPKARELRALRDLPNRESLEVYAKRYGVSRQSISDIWQNKTWVEEQQ